MAVRFKKVEFKYGEYAMPNWLKSLIIISFVLAAPMSETQEICASTPESFAAAKRAIGEINAARSGDTVHRVQSVYPLDQFLQKQRRSPFGTPVPHLYEFMIQNDGGRPAPRTEEVLPGPIPSGEECLGDYKCLHGYLHPYYKEAFQKLGCHCYTGRCRPSKFQRVATSETNETGYQIYANKQWCNVPKVALRRDKNRIPETLLQFDAHVCVSDTGCGELECAIIDEGM